MLLKSKDDIAPQLAQLDELLRLPLTSTQRTAIEREKAILRVGSSGERDAAFQIDFRLKDHADWVVIHDLRLEHRDRVAQIDHLIFHPNWEFYVLETKGIRTKMKIQGGQWSFIQNNHWQGMANPVEQNARHIMVLKQLLEDLDWLPRTMSVRVVPRFINVVLVPPGCHLQQNDGLNWVLHMDEFVTKARRDFSLGNAMLNILHSHSGKHARELGEKLLTMHTPLQIDYRKRFGIPPDAVEEPKSQYNRSETFCQSCEVALTTAEVSYCRTNKARFGARMLCRKCQSQAPSNMSASPLAAHAPPKTAAKPPGPAQCAECGTGVDSKVVAFCILRAPRFRQRVLCRRCQRQAH